MWTWIIYRSETVTPQFWRVRIFNGTRREVPELLATSKASARALCPRRGARVLTAKKRLP